MKFQKNDIVGDYRIVRNLGHGGMGIVYLAEQVTTGEAAAIKTVIVDRSVLADKIRQEIRVLSRIHHPGIVRIRDEGLLKGIPWYAMDYLKGIPLSLWAVREFDGTRDITNRLSNLRNTVTEEAVEIVVPAADDPVWWTQTIVSSKQQTSFQSHEAQASRDENLPPSKTGKQDALRITMPDDYLQSVITIMYRISCALAYLHGEGIVHRDLKPDNIIVTDGLTPVIVDFGLTVLALADIRRESLTVEQGVSGTVQYMSPEQIRGELVDSRSDLYSLGCIFHELLVGRPPFVGSSIQEIVQCHLFAPVPLPSDAVPSIPSRVCDLIVSLLHKDPRKRIGFAETVATCLEELGAEKVHNVTIPAPKQYLHRPGFVGRRELLESLSGQLDSCLSGHAGCLFLHGESGIGKTRSLIEIGRLAVKRSFLLLTGSCSERKEKPLEVLRVPLATIASYCTEKGRKVSETILGGRGKILGRYEPSCAAVPGLESEPEPDELPIEESLQRLYRTILLTVTSLAIYEPVVVIFDDMQWADDLTLGFLSYYIAQLPELEQEVFLIAGFRSEETSDKLRDLMHSPFVNLHELTRFSHRGVESMLSEMLALDTPPAILSERLLVLSEGNPFFIAEYLYTAVEEGLLKKDNHGEWFAAPELVGHEKDISSVLPMPRHLHDLVHRQLSHLTDIDLSLTRLAAVLGREMERHHLKAVSSYSDHDFFDAMASLSRRHIIEESSDTIIRFSHDKIREIAYDMIPEIERPQHHRRCAQTIEVICADNTNQVAGELGHHWERALEGEKAAVYYRQAAESAVEQVDFSLAEKFFRASLRLVPTGSAESVMTRNDFAQFVLIDTGQMEEAYELHMISLREAEALNDRYLTIKTLNSLGLTTWRLSRTEESLQHYLTAIDLAREEGIPDLLANILHNTGGLLLDTGRFEEALIYYEESLPLHRTGDQPYMVGRTLGNLALLNYRLGRSENALKCYQEALVVHREQQNRRGEGIVLYNMAGLYLSLGERSKSVEMFQTALQIAREIGNRRSEALILTNLALFDLDRGRCSSAIETLTEALTIQRELGDKNGESLTLSNLGEVEQRRGNFDKAHDYLYRSLEIEEERKNFTGLAEIYYSLADLALTLKDYDSTETRSRRSLELASEKGFSELIIKNHGLLALCASVKGQVDEANRLYDRALEQAIAINNRMLESALLLTYLTFRRWTEEPLTDGTATLNRIEEFYIAVNGVSELMELAIERAFRELALTPSSRSQFEQAQSLIERQDDTVDFSITDRFQSLSRARKAADNNEFTRLYRGELFEDLPEGFRSWLRKSGRM